jgi:hypothetical protein
VSPVSWVVPGLTDWLVQPVVIAALVQIEAVYDAGSVGPADAAKVSDTAPGVVADEAVENPVGGFSWLTSACGDDTPDAGETRYPGEASADTVT